MISRLPKHYRKKYKRELGWDEETMFFAFKVVGSTSLFFVLAAGMDIYRLAH